ncbi:MAG: FAD-dependent oxidoreductase [Candidatus Aenigmarchaeota archaeon]|nr:FAD-dependent oxidoreductase [Candidatus Aenigmarchaeota archaeon]
MELPLIEIKQESLDVKSFKFGLNGTSFNFKPGQYIIMKLDVIDERNGVRMFSLSSSPTETGYIMISTKMTGSNFKKKLESMNIGDKVDIRGPFGRFLLQEDHSKTAVMLTGGIGITPFRDMIKFATDKKLNLKIILLYSNKMPEEISFGKEFDEWQRINPNLKVVYTVTRPEESKMKWEGVKGRIDAAMMKNNVKDMENSIFYVCGPPAMVDAMVTTLKNMGVSDNNIKIERFTGY